MKARVLLILFLALGLPLHAQTSDAPMKMGVTIGKDSSKVSGRSFPKRLFSPKGAWGVGLSGVYLGASGSDSNVMMLLTGINGSFRFGRIYPTVTYTYMDNQAVGLRLLYMGAKSHVDSATALGLADLDMSLSGLGLTLDCFGASAFHRNWFGLDDKGRFAIFLDAGLSYQHLRFQSSYKSLSHRIALTFSPGVEIFVMNFLSLDLSIGLATGYYEFSSVYNEAGERTGRSNGFHFGTGLSLLDINFGFHFYL